jgi:S-adenosylmethionine-diacylglycerol 3-amino-3-carboxypropyl transferase
MQTEQLDKTVDFSIIRYSNCWEDADLLIEAFQDQQNGRYLSICSAGDNSFSLLTLNPEIVIAVDLNDTQLYLAELKIAAIKHFELSEFKQFIGIIESSNREKVYQTILRNQLSESAKTYWDHNLKAIQLGISNVGKFENYFKIFRKYVLRCIHSKSRIETLFQQKTSEEQKDYYQKKWNNKRWKFLFKIFFSKQIMGKAGRDPEFLKQVTIPVGEYIYQKAGNHLMSKACQENYMLQHILTGKYGSDLPHYLKEENYSTIRKNIHKIVLFKGYAQEAIKKYGPFDGMNLSDIFEYQNLDLFEEVSKELINGLQKNGIICYWNLMVPRRISSILPEVNYQKSTSEELTKKDKGFFYNQFIVDKKE